MCMCWVQMGLRHKPWPRCGSVTAENDRHKIKLRRNLLWDRARPKGWDPR